MMVYRLYVEKRADHEAAALKADLLSFLGIKGLTGVRILHRYDVENVDEALLRACVNTLFSEPPLDDVYDTLPETDGVVFAVQYLPGQFDQRADSAAQCMQLVSRGERPTIATARVYLLQGDLSPADAEAIKRYVINPVESREACLAHPQTLAIDHAAPAPVETLDGFLSLDTADMAAFLKRYGLAMDAADLAFCQQYFLAEGRDPTLTEIRVIDTYWSDHCRHTTFLTRITRADFDDPKAQAAYETYLSLRDMTGDTKPVTLMDLATIGAKYLKHTGQLTDLDESDEINACTVRVTADVNGKPEPWLLLFKNETHNHPTEIEPFGGAATCIGGAIRDPLSGRAFVYQAMRVTGAANPLRPAEETLPGKLPQRKLTTTAAAGYSAYGNQIGLATGLVDEWYHDGYAAKRLEIGAVVGAAPQSHVHREVPSPGDAVVLLGGRTGRDGCGGATGSSKPHTADSLSACGAEVQKGNPPEERKLQRLFRDARATRLIKRCNDFGAGGVSVAIGELADGLRIDLGAVPRKYEGLNGTELAISESQERMAVVLAPEDVLTFLALAAEENLEATVVAEVTDTPRLIMEWNGSKIVDITRAFLNSNGAPKETAAHVRAPDRRQPGRPADWAAGMRALAADLNVASKRGLAERFDASIGAGTVLMPFGGRFQMTPPQAMAAKLPVRCGDTTTCSVMAYGFDPYETEADPFQGAYDAVVESVARLVAAGAGYRQAHLTFQEYFERMKGPDTWGKPLAALLGALRAQLDLSLAAIGGKDSMSGSFEQMHVPPTLVSFAVTTADVGRIISPEFKRPGARVALAVCDGTAGGLLRLFDEVEALIREKKVSAAYTPGHGGVAEALMKMAMGNRIGFALVDGIDPLTLFDRVRGAFVLETEAPIGITLGHTTQAYTLTAGDAALAMDTLQALWEKTLELVFPTMAGDDTTPVETYTMPPSAPRRAKLRVAEPRALIPVFPGTNCEYDTACALQKAGAETDIFVIRNLSPRDVAESAEAFARRLENAQILFLPGGFSAGDEPDGSGKFITAFLRNPRIAQSICEMLSMRDGLIGGICNGFQALIKLGLLPYGEIRAQDRHSPTLTFNAIGRHQSRLVRTRVVSTASPWLMRAQPGDIHIAPVSHGEGRFVCPAPLLSRLAARGQIATQYVDLQGRATMDIRCNPNGSAQAVEGIFSPDGRVFGRMAHSERTGPALYKNVPGDQNDSMFQGAVDYFR